MMLMLGSGASEPVRQGAVAVGRSGFRSAVMAIPKQTIVGFNRFAKSFLGTGRAVTKAGEKGLVNLTKFVPLVGGVAGGSIDWGATYLIGRSANRMLRSGPTPAGGADHDGGGGVDPAGSDEAPPVADAEARTSSPNGDTEGSRMGRARGGLDGSWRSARV